MGWRLRMIYHRALSLVLHSWRRQLNVVGECHLIADQVAIVDQVWRQHDHRIGQYDTTGSLHSWQALCDDDGKFCLIKELQGLAKTFFSRTRTRTRAWVPRTGPVLGLHCQWATTSIWSLRTPSGQGEGQRLTSLLIPNNTDTTEHK